LLILSNRLSGDLNGSRELNDQISSLRLMSHRFKVFVINARTSI
jgi:hypothetical protein